VSKGSPLRDRQIQNGVTVGDFLAGKPDDVGRRLSGRKRDQTGRSEQGLKSLKLCGGDRVVGADGLRDNCRSDGCWVAHRCGGFGLEEERKSGASEAEWGGKSQKRPSISRAGVVVIDGIERASIHFSGIVNIGKECPVAD